MGSILDGITRINTINVQKFIVNPSQHSPIAAKNRIKVRVVGPNGKIKKEVDHMENILVTYGLDRLVNMIAGSSNASDWVRNYKIGTSTTAANSSQNALGASTGSVAVESANISDLGARSIRYVVTFASDNPSGAAEIHEVGLFQTNGSDSMIARSVLGTDSVNKGASDQIQISHDVVFTTSS